MRSHFRISKDIVKGFSIAMSEWRWIISLRVSVRDSHSWKLMAICIIFSLWVLFVGWFSWDLLIRSISIMTISSSFVHENSLLLLSRDDHTLFSSTKILLEKSDIIPILRMDQFFRQVMRIMNSISTIHSQEWVCILAHDIHRRIE